MENQSFNEIKIKVQEIIDLISEKKANQANTKLAEVHEILNELIDLSDDDEALVEVSRYQVLLNHLQQKIAILIIEMN